jgi:5-methylcytosine-specific restriction endonuclease McrA
MIASTRKWCSPKCAAHNKRHAVRLERAALGGAPLPTPRPATVILDIKPKRFRRKMKELSALMPPVEGISCRDCRGVVTAWWSVYGNTYARLVCYDCHLRRVRAGHATRKSSGQQKRYKDKPSGAIVACAVCGNHFQRTTGRIKACSDVCSAVLAKERDQRRLQRRRTANTGEPYTIRELRERDGDKCWICVKRIDFTLSGMDPMGPTIDHLLPLSHGGADCKSNVKMAHRQCNVNRSNRGEVVQLLLVG